jgi:hypothetical protein
VINAKVAPNILFYHLAKSHNFLRLLAISFYLIPILHYWKIEIKFKNPFFLTGPDLLTHPTRDPLRPFNCGAATQVSAAHFFISLTLAAMWGLAVNPSRLLPPIPSPASATRDSSCALRHQPPAKRVQPCLLVALPKNVVHNAPI